MKLEVQSSHIIIFSAKDSEAPELSATENNSSRETVDEV